MRTPLRPPTPFEQRLSDGYVVRGRYWPATAPPACAVLYLHGIQSHSGWYEWSASLIAEQAKVALLAPDRRGSGLNTEARGDTPSAERWLADLDEHAAWLLERSGARRLAVVGVSWGGKLALAWAQRARREISDWLLIAPGFFPRVDLNWTAKIKLATALIAAPQKRFPIPLDDPSLFTDTPEGQEFISRDPHLLRSATARALFASARLDRRLRGLSTGDVRGNGTLILASHDRIIRNERTVEWLSRCVGGLSNRTLAGSHTLEFERDASAFEAGLLEWAASLNRG